MSPVKPFLFLALAGGLLGAPPAAEAPPAPDAALHRIVTGLVHEGVPGALAVARTPAGLRRAAAGLGRREPRVALRASDRFRIASVTKTFVATLVLELAADGRLRLGDSIERWLPGLVPGGRNVTLRELLAHTSGLADYDADPKWQAARIADPGRSWTARELVTVAAAQPRLFAPGTSWSYSNTNYVLLGLVVEAATGRPLSQELRDRLLAPLGLRSTSFPSATSIGGRFAHGYVVGRPPLPIPEGTLVDVSSVLAPSAWGAGQIVSNADDLVRFFTALVRGRILPHAQLQAMTSDAARYGYGLGVRIATTQCGRAVGHNGDIPGYRNVVWATLDGRRAVSIMVNVDDARVAWSRLEAYALEALCA